MSLATAVQWVNEGKVFVMCASDAMRAFAKDVSQVDLDTQEVYYFDCNYMPGLIGEGEWDFYLTQDDDNSEITDNELLTRIVEQKSLPNRKYFSANI